MADIYCACDVAGQISCATCLLGEQRNPVKCFRAPWPMFDVDPDGLDVLAKDIMESLAAEDGVEFVDSVILIRDPADPGGKAS